MSASETSPINDETSILESHRQELSGLGLIGIQSDKNTASTLAANNRDHRPASINNSAGLGPTHELSYQSMQEDRAGD